MEKEKSVCREIRTLNNLIRRRMFHSSVHEYIDSVTDTNGWIIGYIADHNDREIYQKDLENEFSLRRSSVSKAIDVLCAKGFINRETVEHDARLKRLVLTEKGLEIHELARKNARQTEEEILCGISEEEINAFFELSKKIRNNIEGRK